MENHADLRLLREMADAVMRAVRQTPPTRFGEILRMGADGTATKQVDDLAEKEILRILERERSLDLVSEEAGHVALGGDRVLVADPIDGTTNAVRGIPFYCVSLAIGRRRLSDVEAALVMNLATGQRYEAMRGRGATLNGKRIGVAPPGERLAASFGIPRGGRGLPKEVDIVRSFGASALEMCLVAQGALDGYVHERPILRTIDVAAATLIVREAGGVVLEPGGADLDLPLTLEPRFGILVASSRDVVQRLREGA